jgi:hypothetical protein
MRRITKWEEIQPGCFWSVHETGIISRAIQFFSRGRYNHSGWIVAVNENGPISQEARNHIERHPLSEYRAEWERGDLAVFCPNQPQRAIDFAIRNADSRVGQSYAWASVVNLAIILPLNWIAGLFSRQIPNPIRRHEFCSEEVLVALTDMVLMANALGVGSGDLGWAMEVPDRDTFTPQDLYDAAAKEAAKVPSTTHPATYIAHP